MKWKYNIGTLLVDRGMICMIIKHLPIGCESFEGHHKINWRDNYELMYPNCSSYIIGANALHGLVSTGQIKLLKGEENS